MALFFWMGLQMILGAWIFISPFVFGTGGGPAAVSDMICGAAVVLLGVIVLIYQFYRPARETGTGVFQAEDSDSRRKHG